MIIPPDRKSELVVLQRAMTPEGIRCATSQPRRFRRDALLDTWFLGHNLYPTDRFRQNAFFLLQSEGRKVSSTFPVSADCGKKRTAPRAHETHAFVGRLKPPPVPLQALLRTRYVRWAPQVRGSDPTTKVGLQAPDSWLAPCGYSIGSSKGSPYHEHRRGSSSCHQLSIDDFTTFSRPIQVTHRELLPPANRAWSASGSCLQ